MDRSILTAHLPVITILVFEIPVTQLFDRHLASRRRPAQSHDTPTLERRPEFRAILETLSSPTEGEFTPTESGVNTRVGTIIVATIY